MNFKIEIENTYGFPAWGLRFSGCFKIKSTLIIIIYPINITPHSKILKSQIKSMSCLVKPR